MLHAAPCRALAALAPATLALATAALASPVSAAAEASCSSDRSPRPTAVLERFINADCETCWQDKATPRTRAGEIAIDWIVPGGKGEDGALAAVALPESLARLEALKRPVPLVSDAVRSAVPPRGRAPRIAQGTAFNDYIGTSIAFRGATALPLDGWLLLVEALAAGTESSPVPRNLVRNVFRIDAPRGAIDEARAMQIHEGAKPSRLRLVALVHDASGRLVAASRSRCAGDP